MIAHALRQHARTARERHAPQDRPCQR